MPTNINFNKTLGIASKGTSIVLPSETAGPEMIFTITTPSDAFTFDLRSVAGFNNYDIDWGDGSAIETGVTDAIKSHTYGTAGLYEIKITGQIYLRQTNATDADCYTEFKQWGTATTITGVREFFFLCQNMIYTATDAPNFDLSIVGGNVYDGPYRLFSTCRSITSLDLSNWDTSQWSGVTTQQAFQTMTSLTSLNITGWDVSNLANGANWFAGSGNSSTGITIIAPNLDWSSCTNMSQMFYNSNIVSVDINNWTLNPAGTNIQQMFRSLGNQVAATGGLDIDISGWTNTGSLNAASGNLFMLSARGISSINMTGWTWSSVTNFNSFTSNCFYLEEIIGLNDFRWDSATSTSTAFANTYRMHFKNHNFHPDFGSNWSSTNFTQCFYRNGYQLATADRGPLPNVTNWDMSNATAARQFFRESKYTDGQTFAPSASWDLSNIAPTNLNLWIYNAIGFETFDWSNVTLSGVTTMSQFFQCANTEYTLETVIFGPNCDFSVCTSFGNAFNNQRILTSVQFDSAVNFVSVTNFGGTFTNVPLDLTSYDNFLLKNDATNNNTSVALTASLAQYTIAVSGAARTQLVTGQSWSITDAGGV